MLEYHNKRYRYSQEYRDQKAKQVKELHARNSENKTYRELVNIRKRIYEKRNVVNNFSEKLEKAEKQLLEMIVKRDHLVVEWKLIQKHSKSDDQSTRNRVS